MNIFRKISNWFKNRFSQNEDYMLKHISTDNVELPEESSAKQFKYNDVFGKQINIGEDVIRVKHNEIKRRGYITVPLIYYPEKFDPTKFSNLVTTKHSNTYSYIKLKEFQDLIKNEDYRLTWTNQYYHIASPNVDNSESSYNYNEECRV